MCSVLFWQGGVDECPKRNVCHGSRYEGNSRRLPEPNTIKAVLTVPAYLNDA